MTISWTRRVRYHRRPPWWLSNAGPPDWMLSISTARNLGQVRRVVSERLVAQGRTDLADDAELVVTELCSNALRHGGGDPHAQGWHNGSHLLLAVSDAGVGPARRVGIRPQAAGLLSLGGRGLTLLTALARIDVVATAAGTMVLATLA